MDEDKKLLSNFLLEDKQAVRKFFEKFGGIIMCAVTSVDLKTNVINHDDLFMEAVIHIFADNKKVIRQFQGKCRLSTYLYTVCRRFALGKILRENRMHSELSASWQDNIPDNLLQETESGDEGKRMSLFRALRRCDADSRLFIRMMFYDNRSTKEIMHFFGWNSENTVYAKKNKIIAKLRKTAKKLFLEKEFTHADNR